MPNKQVKQKIYSTIKKILILRFVFGLLIFSFPIPAHAGVISFVVDFFSNKEQKEIIYSNSQNMALLQAALNSDPNPAKGGGDITIIENTALLPEIGPSGTILNIDEQKIGDKISIYIVRKGDSLSEIAKMFNVSVNTIIWANNLHKSLIKEGQTLIILPISGVKHIIKKGENISSVAKKYKGSLKEISQFNNIKINQKLIVGDILIIPDGEVGSYNYSSSRKNYSTRNRYRGGGGPDYPNYYIKPLKNSRKTQNLHGYNAVDLAAPYGTPIMASASGKIIISKSLGWNGGYGGYVVIQHNNGTQTLYSHSSSNIVYVGQYVVQGQVIGYVGSTGKSTGPHVHFEIRGAKNPF